MRRSERIVRLTRHLVDHPGTALSLTEMAEHYGVAKSSLSEDLAIIRSVFEQDGNGFLRTQLGANGGILFEVDVSTTREQEIMAEILAQLSDPQRILTGGYMFITDVLSQPQILRNVGKMFAKLFAKEEPDVILTVETKGIPLAVITSEYLNIPYVVARRDHNWSEGPSVSTNYVSSFDRRIQSMSLSRRSIVQGARVLILDDFMKAGGTIKGMIALMEEFSATVVGTGVFMATAEPSEKFISSYRSLVTLAHMDEMSGSVVVEPGNYFTERM